LDVIERHLIGFRDARRVRAQRIVERLNALGVPITMESVLAIAGDGAIGRPHVAKALVAGHWARDVRDAFDRFLGNAKPAFVEKQHLGLEEAIDIVHDAGGLAVYAHPGGAATRARLTSLCAIGLDGVEVRHPGHSGEDTARIATLVDHVGLVPSGGSDWHGASDGPRVIGSMHVPEAWLAIQEERVRTATTSAA
jgi:hypothetical protein